MANWKGFGRMRSWLNTRGIYVTEEHHEISPSQYSWCSHWDSNGAPHEYKPRVLDRPLAIKSTPNTSLIVFEIATCDPYTERFASEVIGRITLTSNSTSLNTTSIAVYPHEMASVFHHSHVATQLCVPSVHYIANFLPPSRVCPWVQEGALGGPLCCGIGSQAALLQTLVYGLLETPHSFRLCHLFTKGDFRV
jgi:hypothetical protein